MRIYTHNWGDHLTIYINGTEGFCKLNVYLEDGRNVAELYDMVVYPEFRGQGHGNAILTTAIQEAEKVFCDTLILWPVAEPWIRAWYHRNGFNPDYRFHNYERTPGWSKSLAKK